MDLSSVEVIVNAVVGKSLRSQEGCNAYIFAKVKERVHEEVCDLVTKGLSQLDIILMQKKRLQAIFCGERVLYEEANPQEKGSTNIDGNIKEGLTGENGSEKPVDVTDASAEKSLETDKQVTRKGKGKSCEVMANDGIEGAVVQENGKHIENKNETKTVEKEVDALLEESRKNSDEENKTSKEHQGGANLKQSKQYFEYLAEYKNDPEVYDRVKGLAVRGKNFPVSNDGSCPRCSFPLNAFVVLDFLFPAGDMPEILHYLLTLGKAVLWSSKQTQSFKDPPVFLCQGECPSDIGKSGFNISWRNTDLDKIFLFPEQNFKEKKTKKVAPVPSKSPTGHEDSDEEYYEGDVDMYYYKSQVSWVVLDEIEVKEKTGSLQFDAAEVVRTMLALEEARRDFTNGCMKKLASRKQRRNNKTGVSLHQLGGGMAQILGNYSRGRSKSPVSSPSNNHSSSSATKVNSAPPLPKKAPPTAPPPPICSVPPPPKSSSFSKYLKESSPAVSKPHPPIIIKPIESPRTVVSSSKVQRSWSAAPSVVKPNSGGQSTSQPTVRNHPKGNETVVNCAPTPTHLFKGATYYNSGDDQAKQAASKPAFTLHDFPISTDGACPYCHSVDVVYIILQEDGDTDPLPELLQRLNKMGKAVKRKKGEYDLPSFQCKGCTYGFNLDWKLTNLEKIFLSTNTAKIQPPPPPPPPSSLMSHNVNQNAYPGYDQQLMNNYPAYNPSVGPYAYNNMYQTGAGNPAMMMNQYGNYMQPPMAAMQAMMTANAMQPYASVPSVPSVYGLTPDSMKPPSGYQNTYNSAYSAYNQNQYGGYPPPPSPSISATESTATVTEEATTTITSTPCTTTSTPCTAAASESVDLYDPFNATAESTEPNEPSNEDDPNIKPPGTENESAAPSPSEAKMQTEGNEGVASIGDENGAPADSETKEDAVPSEIGESDTNDGMASGLSNGGSPESDGDKKGDSGDSDPPCTTSGSVEKEEKRQEVENESVVENENDPSRTVLPDPPVKVKSTSSRSSRGKGRGKGARGRAQQQNKGCDAVKTVAADDDSNTETTDDSNTEKTEAVENTEKIEDADDKTMRNVDVQLIEEKNGQKTDVVSTVEAESNVNTDECNTTVGGEAEVESETVENEDQLEDKPLQTAKKGVKRKAPAKRGRGRGRGKKKK